MLTLPALFVHALALVTTHPAAGAARAAQRLGAPVATADAAAARSVEPPPPIAGAPSLEDTAWLAQAASVSPSDAAALAGLRAEAAVALSGCRFPSRKDEAWRRCDVSSLRASRIVAPPAATTEQVGALLEACADVDGSAGMRLVLVNGVCSSELSDLSALPAGVFVGSILSGGGGGGDPLAREAAERAALDACGGALPGADEDLRTTLGGYAFASLNQASMRDLVSVHVGAGVHVERPLHLVMLSTGGDGSDGAAPAAATLAASHPNLVVTVGEGASLSMLQQYAGEGAYFTNAVTRVRLQRSASVRHSYVQEQGAGAVHVDSLLVSAADDASYASSMLQTGGKIARINLDVRLEGGGAASNLRGLTLATAAQLADVHSRVTHVVADCVSEQEQRNAVAGKARVVFRGAVVVPTGADNTTANQLCRTLLLSDSAKVDVAPTLEIDTDDVQCTHGATISDLDDEMIFYLQSRGLGRLNAKTLLLEGWARSALDEVPVEKVKQRAAAKAATLTPEDERRVRRESMSSI